MIEIYTDGSARKSGSGWAFVVLVDKERVHEEAGFAPAGVTNQAMELQAAIKGCQWTTQQEQYPIDEVIVYSDSAYLVNCYNQHWWATWMSNGWLNTKGEAVVNQELWVQLVPYFRDLRYTFDKVKAHSGHLFNERADHLAKGKEISN